MEEALAQGSLLALLPRVVVDHHDHCHFQEEVGEDSSSPGYFRYCRSSDLRHSKEAEPAATSETWDCYPGLQTSFVHPILQGEVEEAELPEAARCLQSQNFPPQLASPLLRCPPLQVEGELRHPARP